MYQLHNKLEHASFSEYHNIINTYITQHFPSQKIAKSTYCIYQALQNNVNLQLSIIHLIHTPNPKKEKFLFIYQLYAKKFDTNGMPFFPKKRNRLEINRDHAKWILNPPRELSSSLTDTRYKKENYGERCPYS